MIATTCSKLTTLTDEQRRLVEEFVATWPCPAKLVKKIRPGTLRYALACKMTWEDVNQVAMLGVMRAAKSYDPTKASFTTYAGWWAAAAVERQASRLDTRKLGKVVSGDAKGHDGEGCRFDDVSDRFDSSGDPQDNDRLDEVRRRVADALRMLPERYATVVKMRYGINGCGDPMTLEQVGDKLGITRERVRQLEAKALDRISVPLQLGCRDLVNLGDKPFTAYDHLKTEPPTPEPEDDMDKAKCPKCGVEYPNQDYRRCFPCERSAKPDKPKEPKKAAVGTLDLVSLLAAVDDVKAAVAVLPVEQARQVLEFVALKL